MCEAAALYKQILSSFGRLHLSTMYVSTLITCQQQKIVFWQALSSICNPVHGTYSNMDFAYGRLSGGRYLKCIAKYLFFKIPSASSSRRISGK